MKVLFLNTASPQTLLVPSQAQDYLVDSCLLGLRRLLGENVVDVPYMWHCYNNANPKDLSKMPSKGFTLYGLLDNNLNINRQDWQYKVEMKDYFDIIVIGMHHSTCRAHNALLNLVQWLHQLGYSKNRVVFLDGWDRNEVKEDIAELTTYFKRELLPRYKDKAYPISFSIPEENITVPLPPKYDFAPLVPAFVNKNTEHLKTYIYEDERSYYDDYRRSYFAFDQMKAGAQTMRALEILACGCVPWFMNIERVPEPTWFNYPKGLVREAKTIKGVYPGVTKDCETYNPPYSYIVPNERYIKHAPMRGFIDWSKFDHRHYDRIRFALMEHVRRYMTTKDMAQYILDIISNAEEIQQ